MYPSKDRALHGDTFLGVELGSTRIKAILMDETHRPLASASYTWESRLENGDWTYSLEEVWSGVQACIADLLRQAHDPEQTDLATVRAIGISGMMHGYLAFDQAGALLAPFRTWRSAAAAPAAQALTEALGVRIPRRWTAAHLYQSILNREPHIADVRFLTTLAGYVHWRLTGERVVGVGEASGMFPVDCAALDFDDRLLRRFDELTAAAGYQRPLRTLLPRVCAAGCAAGRLTEAGARLLDPSGTLRAGISLCPPEGDAGTGMVATNSVEPRTANVSAGTSVFAMVVLEEAIPGFVPDVDSVATPSGEPAVMVHCNNCSSDLDHWIRLFQSVLAAFGVRPAPDALYETLFEQARLGDADCGGLLAYNYLSGEPLLNISEGCPLLLRGEDSRLTLPNFMRTQLYAAFAALCVGMDRLTGCEHVHLDRIAAHGGMFKAAGAAQRVLAAALHTPVSVTAAVGEGGAWGMAILAAYQQRHAPGERLGTYLQKRVFADAAVHVVQPDPEETRSFRAFLSDYARGLELVRAAAALQTVRGGGARA